MTNTLRETLQKVAKNMIYHIMCQFGLDGLTKNDTFIISDQPIMKLHPQINLTKYTFSESRPNWHGLSHTVYGYVFGSVLLYIELVGQSPEGYHEAHLHWVYISCGIGSIPSNSRIMTGLGAMTQDQIPIWSVNACTEIH